MSSYIINGNKKLMGEVKISGAKNATLGILAASLLANEEVTIENIPDVKDINIMLQVISNIGVSVNRVDRNTVKINPQNIKTTIIDDMSLRNIRAGYYLVGALLGKCKSAKVRLPGGCDIGKRPIDLHLKGFNSLKANAYIEDDFIVTNAHELVGSNIYLDVVSVGATINIMLAACLSQGTTIIENVAKEPHVVDVANFLNSMGANIKGAGTDIIRIKGVKNLHGTNYSIIPDQIEAGTYMILSAITAGDIIVKNVIPKHLESIIAKLIDMGNNVIVYDEAVRVIGNEKQLATSIKTMPYPGFPTDLQPQIACTLSTAKGDSVIVESIFENRFKYVNEIKKMGAVIEIKNNTLNIVGIDKLTGAELKVTDLRAGAALVLSALSANGISKITNIEYIERGYEDFENKLKDLGADIKKEE